jgi:uncharacterized SAM-binding protein YcdF (DUF218 family)
VRIAAVLSGLSGVAFLPGFVGFVAMLDRYTPAALPRGDAIVALTGGADRIPDAVDWLAQGNGQRLLISGVGPQVGVEALAQKSPALRSWLSCCVDLGHSALNTVGNAEETRDWATVKGYRSLVVVTSSYHMPRALLELQRHMPDMRLIAAPVVTDRLQGKGIDDPGLWTDVPLLRMLGQEYGKFLVAYVRARLTSPASPDHITANTNRRRAS